MAPIQTVLSLALFLSTGSLALADLLLAFYNQNPNNLFIYLALHTFLFLLVTSTILSTILVFLIHVAVQLLQSPIPAFLIIKYFTMATQAIACASLLIGVPLMIYVAIAAATIQGAVKAVVIAAMAVMVYKPLKRYFDLAGQTASVLVPAFLALGTSTGILLPIHPTLSFSYLNHDNPLSHVVALLLLFYTFLLGIGQVLLQILRMSRPEAIPQAPARADLIEIESKLKEATSFITAVSALLLMVALLVRLV